MFAVAMLRYVTSLTGRLLMFVQEGRGYALCYSLGHPMPTIKPASIKTIPHRYKSRDIDQYGELP